MAFKLGDEEGFRWVGAYEISADDLLDGKEGKPQFSGESPFSPTVDLDSQKKEIVPYPRCGFGACLRCERAF